MPAYYDGTLFTVNMKQMPNSDPLIGHNSSINTIYASNDLDEEQDFVPVLDAIQGVPVRRAVPTTEPLTLSLVAGRLGQLFSVLQEVDAAPTPQAAANVNELRAAVPALTAKWKALRSAELMALNAKLRAAGLAEIKVEEKPLSRVIGVDVNVRRGEVAGEE